MPAELLSIPDIVVGSVVGGDLVLRNVVVSTDSQLPSNIPQLPPSRNTGIVPPQHQHGQLDQFVSDLKVPANLPTDAVVVLIDSKTNSIVKASPSESEDFIAGGAYFIGAFDRATADKVVADMIKNPIPSTDHLVGKFYDSAVKLGVTSYVVGVEIFRAMQTAKNNWNNFVTLNDQIMNPPSSVSISPATKMYPLKLSITAHQLDPNLSPESMEEVSGEIGALFPNYDTKGFSIESLTPSEFVMVGTVASASALEYILNRLTDVNNGLAKRFPSGIITVVPYVANVQPPVVYEGDEPVRGGAGGLVHTLPYTQDYAQPALAQQYLDLSQAIAEMEDNGDDVIFGADHPFTEQELQGLLSVGDATVRNLVVNPPMKTPVLYSGYRSEADILVYTDLYFSGSFDQSNVVGIGLKGIPIINGMPTTAGFWWVIGGSRTIMPEGYPKETIRVSFMEKSDGYALEEQIMPKLKTASVIVPNSDVFKSEASINPRYAQLVNARDTLGASMGVPSGCQPIQPHILPPTQVPAGCAPIPPEPPRDFPPYDPPYNPPYDPPYKRPPRPPTKLPCGGRTPCVLVGYIAGGKKGTHRPRPRPPHNSDGSYDDDPKLDHWDGNGNMIDQNGNVMHV
jgi:hypothetical protein